MEYNKDMYVKVVVTPSAKKEAVEEKEGMFFIRVKEPAQGNHANRRVREVLARQFGTDVRSVRILTGHHARSKMISIANL